MDPAFNGWRNELQKYFRSIETISEKALKQIKRDRNRYNLPFDDSFKDFVLKRTSTRIADVYTNLMYEEILDDDQMLTDQNDQHQNNVNGLGSIRQQLTSTAISAESIDQMPIILVPPNNQNYNGSTTFAHYGNELLSEQMIISIPSNQILSSVHTQSVRMEHSRTGGVKERPTMEIPRKTVAKEPLTESNLNKNTEKPKVLADRLNVKPSSNGADRRKRNNLFQWKVNSNKQQYSEWIDLTSDQEDVVDSLDNDQNVESIKQPNVWQQKVYEARVAENLKKLEKNSGLTISSSRIESLKISRNREQKSTIDISKNTGKSTAYDGNFGLVINGAGTVKSHVNKQIPTAASFGSNIESIFQRASSYRNGGHELAGRQKVSHIQHTKASAHEGVKNVSKGIGIVAGPSQPVVQRRRMVNHAKMGSKNLKKNQKLEQIRTHTGERTHKCTLCVKQFIRKDNLNNHMNTHRDSYQFQCSICRLGFSHEVLRKLHEGRCKTKRF